MGPRQRDPKLDSKYERATPLDSPDIYLSRVDFLFPYWSVAVSFVPRCCCQLKMDSLHWWSSASYVMGENSLLTSELGL